MRLVFDRTPLLLCLLCLYYAYYACTMPTMPVLCLLCLYYAYYACTMPVLCLLCLYYAYYACTMPVLCLLCLFITTRLFSTAKRRDRRVNETLAKRMCERRNKVALSRTHGLKFIVTLVQSKPRTELQSKSYFFGRANKTKMSPQFRIQGNK